MTVKTVLEYKTDFLLDNIDLIEDEAEYTAVCAMCHMPHVFARDAEIIATINNAYSKVRYTIQVRSGSGSSSK